MSFLLFPPHTAQQNNINRLFCDFEGTKTQTHSINPAHLYIHIAARSNRRAVIQTRSFGGRPGHVSRVFQKQLGAFRSKAHRFQPSEQSTERCRSRIVHLKLGLHVTVGGVVLRVNTKHKTAANTATMREWMMPRGGDRAPWKEKEREKVRQRQRGQHQHHTLCKSTAL